jgi:hypothetical protein
MSEFRIRSCVPETPSNGVHFESNSIQVFPVYQSSICTSNAVFLINTSRSCCFTKNVECEVKSVCNSDNKNQYIDGLTDSMYGFGSTNTTGRPGP